MAKLSKIVANERRKKIVKRFEERRKELKELSVNHKLTQEEREESRMALAKLPRDSAPTRVRNRCALTGRTRGYLRKFGMSRLSFRQLALQGYIPGVRKASW